MGRVVCDVVPKKTKGGSGGYKGMGRVVCDVVPKK